MGWLQTVGFLTIGLLVEIFVAGLLFSINGGRGFGIGIGLLVCFGFGLLLIGAFHTDPAGNQRTLEGVIHSATSRVVFVIFPVATLLIAPSLKKDPNWQGLFFTTIIIGVLSLVLAAGWFCIRDEPGWFGLYERILVANTAVWVILMAVRLLRLSLNSWEKLENSAIT